MFKLADEWIVSSSDYVAQMDCDTRSSLNLALASGLLKPDSRDSDDSAMGNLTKKYGDLHESQVLAELTSRGLHIVTIQRPAQRDEPSLRSAADRTIDALRAGVDVVYQATFFDGSFYGMADFVMRVDDGTQAVRYEVFDTKLARSVKPGAILQLAAYSEQLAIAGFELPTSLHVWLGDGQIHSYRVEQVLPYLKKIRRDLRAKLQHPKLPVPTVGTSGPGLWPLRLERLVSRRPERGSRSVSCGRHNFWSATQTDRWWRHDDRRPRSPELR